MPCIVGRVRDAIFYYQMNEQRKPPRPALHSSAERRQRVVPLPVQLAGTALNALSLLHNEAAARLLTRFWFTTFKSKPRPWITEFWNSAERRVQVAVEDTVVDVHCWGQGPLVVMMHGWSGSGAQYRDFVEPLVAAGFTAVSFDAPEHGARSGRRTHMLRFCASLLAIQRELGRIDCVIAHSLGAMATAYALQLGLDPARLVCVAPQLDSRHLFDGYRRLLRLRPALAQRSTELIGERLRELMQRDDPWETLQPAAMLGERRLPGMLVFDLEDPEMPAEQFREAIDGWPDCRSLETRGLGHNRILRDPGVIDAIVGYLRG